MSPRCLKQQKSQHPDRELAFAGQSRWLGLLQRAQAADTNVEAFGGLTILNGHLLDVRQPTANGSFLGVTYVMAKLRTLPANIASDCHLDYLFLAVDRVLKRLANIPQEADLCKSWLVAEENMDD